MRRKKSLTFYYDGFGSIKQINKDINLTSKIRQTLYKIFLENDELELTRQELLIFLVRKYVKMTNYDGEIREGIFDGMMHKSEEIPIPFVKKIKRGNKTFYIYTGGGINMVLNKNR